jgi:hypothetical protein
MYKIAKGNKIKQALSFSALGKSSAAAIYSSLNKQQKVTSKR